MSRKQRSTANLIVTEGNDECGLVEALIRQHQLPCCDCLSAEGSGNLSAQARAAWNTPGPMIRRFALIRDAEADPDAASRSASGVFQDLSFPRPTGAFQVQEHNSIRFGFVILPDDRTAGAVENICLRAPKSVAAMRCVGELFSCVEHEGAAQFASPVVRNKAMIQAYLAAVATERVVHRVGLGAGRGHFDLSHAVFDGLAAFLKQLLA